MAGGRGGEYGERDMGGMHRGGPRGGPRGRGGRGGMYTIMYLHTTSVA